MTSHPLRGHLSVEDSARRIRRYRYVEERMMRILGGWIALTPELPVKLLFGRHTWDCAQHADRWGKRLPELRAPAQQSESPGPAFASLVDSLESAEEFHRSPERLAGVYRLLKPALVAAYQRHLVQTNAIYEPPTRRILAQCLAEEQRHLAAGEALLRRLERDPGVQARVEAWTLRAIDALATSEGVAGDGDVSLATWPDPATVGDIDQDLVLVEKPATAWPVPGALVEALDVHGRAILASDMATATRLVEAPAREASRPVYAELAGLGATAAVVVGCARIGAQWLVKQRLTAARGVEVVQARWTERAEGWRVAEVEIVRREPPGP